MQIEKTPIPDLLIISPSFYGDERGFFMESFNQRDFTEASGVKLNFVQDNHSKSKKGVLRGLHYQIPYPQGKLVRVTAGEVFDVAIDLRRRSKSFGKHYSLILSESNRKQLWVPPGFAHGFLVLSDTAEFLYKTTDYYHPETEKTLAWDDPDLNIAWPMRKHEISLSAKDQNGTPLSHCQTYD